MDLLHAVDEARARLDGIETALAGLPDIPASDDARRMLKASWQQQYDELVAALGAWNEAQRAAAPGAANTDPLEALVLRGRPIA